MPTPRHQSTQQPNLITASRLVVLLAFVVSIVVQTTFSVSPVDIERKKCVQIPPASKSTTMTASLNGGDDSSDDGCEVVSMGDGLGLCMPCYHCEGREYCESDVDETEKGLRDRLVVDGCEERSEGMEWESEGVQGLESFDGEGDGVARDEADSLEGGSGDHAVQTEGEEEGASSDVGKGGLEQNKLRGGRFWLWWL
jgi:hypothetical protein